jgi:hypothetical protein
MGSNNYAEVITDTAQAHRVLADLNRLAALGRPFKVLEFNPEVDRFAISLGRESTFPSLEDVEASGIAIDGPIAKSMWSSHGDAAQALDFGNGYVGLCYESDGLSYVAIANDDQRTELAANGTSDERKKKFGHDAHPSINEQNTHTTEEMESPEFRARVETFKMVVLRAAVVLGENKGVFWQAIHELALEFLEADKGEEHADQYLKALRDYEEWAFRKGLAPAQNR